MKRLFLMFDPVIENIFERKSVRHFDVEETVSQEELELLVKAGRDR